MTSRRDLVMDIDPKRRLSPVAQGTTHACAPPTLSRGEHAAVSSRHRALHDGPHPHLVDEQLFSWVQALLSGRGEDYSKRASATSEFLLAGLVVCTKCGKRFPGTSAFGKRYRYRYYTCFSRQRYGTRYCDAERLPADELDTSVLDAALAT